MITALFTNFKYATVRISKFVFFLEFMKDSLTFIWSFVPLKNLFEAWCLGVVLASFSEE